MKQDKKINEYIPAIVLNISLMAVFFLLFEPTAKSDDYDMMNVLYGGYNGEYSPFMLYVNPLYGYLLVALVRFAPGLPWYFIVQYGLMLWGMVEITIVFLKKTFVPWWILAGLLSFVYYECFIRITFTKTAGLLIACGCIVLFYQIDSFKRFNLGYLKGIVLILVGNLIRDSMIMIVIEVLAGDFFIFLIASIQKSGRGEVILHTQNCKNTRKKLWKQMLLFIMFASSMFFCTQIITNIGDNLYDNDSTWKDYRAQNNIRGILFDYGIPDYGIYSEEYKKLGISYNDYKTWFTTGLRDDAEVLSSELMSDIRTIANHEVQVDKGTMSDWARHSLIEWCFDDTMFYFFLCCAILVLFTNPNRSAAYTIFIVLITCLIPFFILYMRGRTQHHVDAVIFITGSFILLYNCEFQNMRSCKNLSIMLACIMTVCFINNNERGLRTSSYYLNSFGDTSSQKAQYAANKADLDLLVDDSSHLYLFNVMDTNTIYPAFTVGEIIPRMYYHNLHRLNMDHIPIHRDILADFDVSNPFKEIVDSNTMYFYISKVRHNRGDVDTFLKYIREHYVENAVMDVVKTTEQGYVCRCYTDKLTLPDAEFRDPSPLTHEIQFSYDEENQAVTLSGYLYETGTDSFAQNIYVEVADPEDGSVWYYPAWQSKNQALESLDKYSGKYSAFNRRIVFEDRDISHCSVSLILENENGIYRMPIQA